MCSSPDVKHYKNYDKLNRQTNCELIVTGLHSEDVRFMTDMLFYQDVKGVPVFIRCWPTIETDYLIDERVYRTTGYARYTLLDKEFFLCFRHVVTQEEIANAQLSNAQ